MWTLLFSSRSSRFPILTMYSIFIYVLLVHVYINTTQAGGVPPFRSSASLQCLNFQCLVEAHLCTVSTLSAASTALSIPPRACLSINRWWKPSLPSLVTDKTGRTKIQKAKLTSMGKPNDLLKSCMIVQLTPGRGEVKALQRGGWYQDVFYFRGKPRYFQTTEVMIHARHTGSLVL